MNEQLKSFEDYVSQNEIEYCCFDFYPEYGDVIVEANHATRLDCWQELVKVENWREFVAVAGKFCEEINIGAAPWGVKEAIDSGADPLGDIAKNLGGLAV